MSFGVYAVYKMPSCCISCRHGTATIGIDWVSVQMLCLHTFHDIVWPNRYTYQLQSQTLQPSICTQSSAHPSSTCHAEMPPITSHMDLVHPTLLQLHYYTAFHNPLIARPVTSLYIL